MTKYYRCDVKKSNPRSSFVTWWIVKLGSFCSRVVQTDSSVMYYILYFKKNYTCRIFQ